MTVQILAGLAAIVWIVSVIRLGSWKQLHHGWVLVVCFLPVPNDVQWIAFVVGLDDALAHFIEAFVKRDYLGNGHMILEWVARKISTRG